MDYPAPEKKPGEDEVLDLDLEDLEEAGQPPAPEPGEVLDVTLDDEEQAPAPGGYAAVPPYPAAEAYPEVTEGQQRAAANFALLQCACSATRQGFEVRFEEQEPGVYYATEITPSGKGPAAAGKGGGGLAQIKGTFRLGPEFACPHCHDGTLSVCEACECILCGGGTTKGGGCACPACGTELTLTSQAATGARGAAGGKKKGLW